MTMTISRRLPDGTTTKDTKLYLKSWKALGEKALSFFPGWVLAAFDPGVVLEKRENVPFKGGLSHKTYKVVDRLNFSVEACETLIKADKR